MISIVAPVHNESENLERLHTELSDVLITMGVPYEIILVDDGSTDGSAAVMRELAKRDTHVRIICLRRNYGQTAAFAAGIDHARGDVIITIDADNQNDPADIPKLLAKMSEGYEVVSGWRYQRQDAALSRKLPSRVANWLIGKVTGVRLHDYGCSLKAYDGAILRSVRLYGEMHRFIPALCNWHGARVGEIKVNHRPRTRGTSKYGLSRTLRVVLDLLTIKFLISFSTRPLHVFGTAGLGCAVAGLGICGWLITERVLLGLALSSRPLFLLGTVLILAGMQLISMGLLGEMLARIYHESQHKPIYVIREVVERDANSDVQL